ncbi:MAG: fibronectin type III domain-containing protein [Candidatus Nanopelagicales bacterium]
MIVKTPFSCTVSGLNNGQGYVFTVTARNAIGTSAPSAQSAQVNPGATKTRPGKVKGVKVKVRKGTAKVTWKRTAGATSYKARISKPGGKKYNKWKKTSKRVFKAKVRKGKKYRFQVAATGSGGRGPITTKKFKGE